MKKFLSSLLALTMILSLVIVPANATNTCSVSKTSVQLTKGSSSSETVTVSGAPEGASFEWSSTSGAVTVTRNESNNNVATISLTDAATKDTTATISCHITKAAVEGSETPAFDETVSVSVTVTDPLSSVNPVTVIAPVEAFTDPVQPEKLPEKLQAPSSAVRNQGRRHQV